MLSAARVRNACPKCRISSFSLHQANFRHQKIAGPRGSTLLQHVPIHRQPLVARHFATSNSVWQTETRATVEDKSRLEEVEKVVREAKQRFRDTLPKDYLNEEEYALYERLYGPPLRETTPEDVGIPMHADMAPTPSRPDNEGTLLRQLESGEFEEVSYEITQKAIETGGEVGSEIEMPEDGLPTVIEKAPGYVEIVARNQREYDAMLKLAQDYEETRKKQKEEAELAKSEEQAEATLVEEESAWPSEEEYVPTEDPEDLEDMGMEVGEYRRFHPYTLEGRYHDSPVEMVLPYDEFITPIRQLLERSHPKHVRQAAEDAFGGPGLPTSPATPDWRRNGPTTGVGLPPDQRHMTEIEADAFLAGYLPPAYASVLSILREVRRRAGSSWLQSRLKQGKDAELSVLDAGAGGAGLVAWQQVLQAEWDVLKEKGEVEGDHPPGRKTVIVGSERLRNRVKSFLPDTTFLPRLPDYLHSTYKGENLDAGSQPLPRKTYDVIIASHLFLKEKQEHYRQAVLNNLWSLLKEDGGVLIIMEKAHPRGFEAVAQVRDTLLKRYLLPQSGEPVIEMEEINPRYKRELEKGHIIAPCTNHQVCPMYLTPGRSHGRKDYCHFSQRFVRPAFNAKLLGSTDSRGEVEYSYVAFQRGVTKEKKVSGKEATDLAFKGYERATEQPDMESLPRMMRPALKRKGHVTMDFCTPEGKVERWTVSKSFSKLAYHDARKTRWGDLWALGAKTRTLRNVRVGRGPGDENKARKSELSRSEKRAVKEQRTRGKANRKRELLKEAFGKPGEEELEQEKLPESIEDEYARREAEMDLEEEEQKQRERERGAQ